MQLPSLTLLHYVYQVSIQYDNLYILKTVFNILVVHLCKLLIHLAFCISAKAFISESCFLLAKELLTDRDNPYPSTILKIFLHSLPDCILFFSIRNLLSFLFLLFCYGLYLFVVAALSFLSLSFLMPLRAKAISVAPHYFPNIVTLTDVQ